MRINEVEYMSNGRCTIGVYESAHELKKFALSDYCTKPSWLFRFEHKDLKMIWQLTKRQYGVLSLKRLVTFALIKGYFLTCTLNSWEAELKSYVSIEEECDEW